MRRGTTPVTAVVLAAALTGCGILPDRQGGGGEERQAASQSQTVSQSQTEEPATAEAQTSAAAEELRAIASRKVANDESNLRIDITGLKRQGKIATLTWTVANLDTAPDDWYVGNKLGSATLDWTVSGVTLIDSVNGRRYRVARNGTDEKAACVCSRVNVRIKGGGSLEMYAVYGAPPPDITKVNVEFPNLGVFTDVPVS
ncbi:hypothetical protein [Streptosporangium subroseum]|uniref:hypothetical protein n=1 Tax=Streptosporangium subroseum TaxID=106412 RepID=UPI00308FA18E|nr:hypothetical protein OHB15_00515 [Streptosporangium subroseum]